MERSSKFSGKNFVLSISIEKKYLVPIMCGSPKASAKPRVKVRIADVKRRNTCLRTAVSAFLILDWPHSKVMKPI